MALGATRKTIVGLIAQEFGRTIGVGLLAGLLVAFALTRLMSSLLFGINALDATTFSTVPVLMALIAAAAVYVPVRRAMRGAVIEALRAE
jgi:ABC-type antimicrobial peptide transport system permease subunit